MTRIPSAAERGFTRGSDAYERGRPSYPSAALQLLSRELGLEAGRSVVDIGAGTGKMSRLLAGTGARVIAVEPVAAMREKLAALAPGVEARDGTAESLPLADAEVDAGVVAQAFHWFDAKRALPEIARVLKSEAGLALVWNSRDTRLPWVLELGRILQWNAGSIPTYDRGDEAFEDVLEQSGVFTRPNVIEFSYAQDLDEATLVDRVLSVSTVALLAEPERAQLAQRVRDLVAGFPTRFSLPYRTLVYLSRRVG